jgi:hypothetical protein
VLLILAALLIIEAAKSVLRRPGSARLQPTAP